MNNTFNINRFSLSIRRLFVEKGIKLFGSVISILAVIFIFLYLAKDNVSMYFSVQNAFAMLGLMFGPILYTWILANEFSSQSKGISYLLMPLSIFEKWVLNVLVAIALYYGLFLLTFRGIDAWMVSRITTELSLPSGALGILSFGEDHIIFGILIGIIVSLSILIGSLYFKKNGLILSLLFVFLGLVALFILNHVIANIIFEEHIAFWDQVPFATVVIESSDSLSGLYILNPESTLKTKVLTTFVPMIILLSAIYFTRLREKQL